MTLELHMSNLMPEIDQMSDCCEIEYPSKVIAQMSQSSAANCENKFASNKADFPFSLASEAQTLPLILAAPVIKLAVIKKSMPTFHPIFRRAESLLFNFHLRVNFSPL